MLRAGHNSRRWIKVRIAILAMAILVAFGAVARGAWDLGITRSAELTSLAKDQYVRRVSIPARRGMITDRHGIELAVEVEADSVYSNPGKVSQPMAVKATVARALGMPESEVYEKLTSPKSFVWLKRRVLPDMADQIRALKLEGLDVVKESKRFYPNRNLASHVIGFAGIDSVGLEGVELKFDNQLRGQKDAVLGLRDARGRMVFSNKMFGPQGVVGASVELTLDRTLQYIAEQELDATVRAFNAKAGHVVIMEPHTGEVLAMANWPSYNPNSIQTSVPDDRRNRAVLDVFEPGSTFKIFSLAAVLNSGVIRPDDLIFCERGRMEIHDTVIHDDHRDGWLNPTQCIKRSSNICFSKMALKLGKKRFYHYMRRFGFGERTHVDLPFESGGVLHHYKRWYDFDTATISYGQGIGVTGIQLALAASAVANGGVLMRPLLVKRIVGPNGETIRNFPPRARRRVISRYTARLVGDMMTAVTEEGGTGVRGALKGYLVAGKTGTAQKSDGASGYHEEKWIASFLSFVPADKPRLVISVVIDEPLINHVGGVVAAPMVKRIADQALRYLGVAPRHAPKKKKNRDQLALGRKVRSEPSPQSANAVGNSGGIAEENELVRDVAPIQLAPGQVRIPDLAGMSMLQAMNTLSTLGLRPLFMGTGFAMEQAPPAGDPINQGAFVQVNFRPIESPAPPNEGSQDSIPIDSAGAASRAAVGQRSDDGDRS